MRRQLISFTIHVILLLSNNLQPTIELQLVNSSNIIKLLYVEDEEPLHFLFRKTLPPEYELFSAGDGDEALEMVRQHPDIAIVVSDHRMPGMTGVALLEEFYRR